MLYEGPKNEGITAGIAYVISTYIIGANKFSQIDLTDVDAIIELKKLADISKFNKQNRYKCRYCFV